MTACVPFHMHSGLSSNCDSVCVYVYAWDWCMCIYSCACMCGNAYWDYHLSLYWSHPCRGIQQRHKRGGTKKKKKKKKKIMPAVITWVCSLTHFIGTYFSITDPHTPTPTLILSNCRGILMRRCVMRVCWRFYFGCGYLLKQTRVLCKSADMGCVVCILDARRFVTQQDIQLDDMIAVGRLTTVITPVIIGSAEQNVARKSCLRESDVWCWWNRWLIMPPDQQASNWEKRYVFNLFHPRWFVLLKRRLLSSS